MEAVPRKTVPHSIVRDHEFNWRKVASRRSLISWGLFLQAASISIPSSNMVKHVAKYPKLVYQQRLAHLSGPGTKLGGTEDQLHLLQSFQQVFPVETLLQYPLFCYSHCDADISDTEITCSSMVGVSLYLAIRTMPVPGLLSPPSGDSTIKREYRYYQPSLSHA